MRRICVTVLLAGMAGAGLAWAAGARLAQPQQAVAANIERPAAPPRIMALGRIEPSSEVIRIAGPSGQDAGRIASIAVQEGDWVEQGQIIAVLDTRPRLAAAVSQAEATLAQRQAAFAKTAADLDSQEKLLAAAVEQQEAQRDRAKWDFDRLQQLQRSGIYRDTALTDRRLALDAANFALASAQQQLDRSRVRDASGQRIDEIAARAEIASAEAALSKARADHDLSAIKAPISGRIIRRLGRVGEQTGQDGVVEMADTRRMYVRAEVFEGDLRRIGVGAAASVTSRALDAPLTGSVERLGLRVNRQTILGEDPAAALDARVVDVLIRLDPASSARAATLTGLQVRVAFGEAAGS